MIVRAGFVLLAVCAASFATAAECPLGRATLAPVDEPSAFAMNVTGNGDGYVFELLNRRTSRIIRFTGSFQNGTGFLVLDQDGVASGQTGVSTRASLFRENLKSADPWGSRPHPVAYAFFDRLHAEMSDQARAAGVEATADRVPPDGLWVVTACRP